MFIGMFFALRDDFLKYLRMLHGDFAQDLSIQNDPVFLECGDQFGVGCSEFSRGGIDADLHQHAIVSLFELASDVGVLSGLRDGCLGDADFGLSSPHHSFRALENVLSALGVHDTSFNTWHMGLR